MKRPGILDKRLGRPPRPPSKRPRLKADPQEPGRCPLSARGPPEDLAPHFKSMFSEQEGVTSVKVRTRWRAVFLVTAGLLVGYIIGPPIVQAATTLVRIQSCCSSAVASVDSKHQLRVRTSARYSSVFALTEPSGETVLVSSSTGVAKSTGSFNSDIVGISVDVPTAGSSPVTVVLRKGNVLGSGQIIWQGTIQTVGHIDYTFGQSILFLPGAGSGFNVTVSNTGGATVQYEVYGFGFGVPCCAGQHLARP